MTLRDEPVKRIVVDAHYPLVQDAEAGVYIELVLNLDFDCKKHPLQHTILAGKSPSGKMEQLANIGSATAYVDVNRRTTLEGDVWYAVMTVDSEGEQYFSAPQKLAVMWEKREWLIARKIVRSTYARLIKRRAGTFGYLARRLNSGEPCPCIDPDTGQTTGQCPECYGTPFVGGYEPVIPCWVDANPEKTLINLRNDGGGMTSDTISMWNVLAYPTFRSNDYWMDAVTGIWYKVGPERATVVKLQNTPIIQQIKVTQEVLSEPIYDLPVN